MSSLSGIGGELPNKGSSQFNPKPRLQAGKTVRTESIDKAIGWGASELEGFMRV